MSIDADPESGRETRLRTLGRATDEGLVCFPAHFRGPTVGRVLRDGDAFRYRYLDRAGPD